MNVAPRVELQQALTSASRGWQARLELGFAQRGERTALVHRLHRGPLQVQKTFHPEGEVCHVYVLHPPGGVVGGDELRIDVRIDRGAHALITTPAANKFYRSAGAQARLAQRCDVASGGVLEWLPQETIVFDGSRVHSGTEIRLAQAAKAIGWEITCLGRPASGVPYQRGDLVQQLRLYREAVPQLWETLRLSGDAPLMQAAWGLQDQSVFGSLWATPCPAEVMSTLREMTEPGVQVGFSRVDEVLVCRALAQHAEPLKRLFERVWTQLRPTLLGRPACPPRIWQT